MPGNACRDFFVFSLFRDFWDVHATLSSFDTAVKFLVILEYQLIFLSLVNSRSSTLAHQPLAHQLSFLNSRSTTLAHQLTLINSRSPIHAHQLSLINTRSSTLVHQLSLVNNRSSTLAHQLSPEHPISDSRCSAPLDNLVPVTPS